MTVREDNYNDESTVSIEKNEKSILLTGKISEESLTRYLDNCDLSHHYTAAFRKDIDRMWTRDIHNCQVGAMFTKTKKTKATDLSNDEMVWTIGGYGYTWSYGQKTQRRLNKYRKMVEDARHPPLTLRMYVQVSSDKAMDDGSWVNKVLNYNQEEETE